MMTNMASQPLVSIVVPTLNSDPVIRECLQSIKDQTYPAIELIVVDNFSQDKTVDIAKEFTQLVFQQGPERSAQRNFGGKKATGMFIVFIDSDMVLRKTVVEDCVNSVKAANAAGVIIPEESFGKGFWADCKRLERSFYVGVDWMEAARFFKKEFFDQAGGYDESLTSGEDWDLSQRISQKGKLVRINSFILHNEGDLKLWKTLRKKFYYAGQIKHYVTANRAHESFGKQSSLLARYGLYLSRPGTLFANPLLGFGMLFMKTAEFGFGGFGYLFSKIGLLK